MPTVSSQIISFANLPGKIYFIYPAIIKENKVQVFDL